MKILRFHTGRGGRFNNQGHVTFIEFERILDTDAFQEYFLNESTGEWIMPSGNALDCEINDNGTGYINDDGEYDSDHWVKEDDLNPKQAIALGQACKYGTHWDEKEMKRILNEYYPNEL